MPPWTLLRATSSSSQPRVLSSELLLPGTVQAISQATVRSKVSAEVRMVSVREGDRVRAARFWPNRHAQLRMQLAERKRLWNQLHAQLAQTERTREVNAQLVKQSFISQNAFDTADAAHRHKSPRWPQRRRNSSKSNSCLATRSCMRRSAVWCRSGMCNPRKGHVRRALMSIVDLAQLEVHAQAAVSDIPQVTTTPAPKSRLKVWLTAFVGRVDRINPAAEPDRAPSMSRQLPNEKSLLKAGMFARVRATRTARQEVAALRFPLQSEAGQSIVWIIADSKLVKRSSPSAGAMNGRSS